MYSVNMPSMDSVARFKAAMDSDKGALGPFMIGTDPAFVEAAGHAGYDFVLLDMEHGTTTFQTLPNLIRAANVAGVCPVVRVPRGTDIWIDQALDVGAGAVMIPQIDTAEQARAAISAAKFSPVGTRGTCRFVRSAGFGAVPGSEYFSKAQDTAVILQAEGKKAVENLDEILDEGDDMQQFTTPRTITGLSNWLNSFTNDELKGMLAITNTIDGQEISILQEALEGHTGKTQFTAFLLSEIASGISSVNNQANAVTVGKPNVYDQLKAFQTVSDLDNFVKTMTDNDKSGCLVYAIYEKADNSKLINTLLSNMSNMTSLLPADTRALTNAYLKDGLDDTNLKVFLDNQSPIAKGLSVLMTLG